MPIINAQILEGRTAAQKADLISGLGEVTRRVLDVPDEAIRVVLTEIAPEHWGVGSRSMAEIRRKAAEQ